MASVTSTATDGQQEDLGKQNVHRIVTSLSDIHWSVSHKQNSSIFFFSFFLVFSKQDPYDTWCNVLHEDFSGKTNQKKKSDETGRVQ